MKQRVFRLVLATLTLVVCQVQWVMGQCAMCRGSVESAVSQGDTSMAANLNLGILYLFFTPYILFGVLAFVWYRNSKRNAQKIEGTSHITR